MFGIKNFIRAEIKKYIESQLEYLVTRTYDENGKMVSSSFYHKVEDGHWANFKTVGSDGFFSEHIRTDANCKALQKDGKVDIESSDLEYDKEHVFKKRFDSRFDKDIIERTNAGIFVVKK